MKRKEEVEIIIAELVTSNVINQEGKKVAEKAVSEGLKNIREQKYKAKHR